MLDPLFAATNPTTGLPHGFIPAMAVFFGLLAMGYNWMVHKNATLSKGLQKKPQRMTTIRSAASPQEVLYALPGDNVFYEFDHYGIDDRQQAAVFGTKHTIWSNGFYHRVRVGICPSGNDGSTVTIETVSKTYAAGPVVTRAHKRFVEAAQDAVERVASVSPA